MFRYKSRKQALLIAALVILLCLVCLAGSTLALFTSDPEDGTIGIVTTAGNIDLDIVDLSGQSLESQTLDFERDGKPVSALFEPGATFRTEGFRVENKGNISIRFRFYISNDPTTNMEEFNRGFEVWVGTDPDDPSKSVPMTEFSKLLHPDAVSEQTYYLFVHMKETAGNEFNRKEQAIYSGIGITVYAVQGNADVSTEE